ncbi:MAG: hypothetical protein LBF75_00010 [Treponema sp.]|jgi:hypothetical protein|nr:hypothetical protein [Treponema sp.]
MTERQNKAYDYFRQQGFLPVDGESYPVFKSYDQGDNRLGELTAVVAVVWGFAYHAVYKVIQGYLCSLWFHREGQAYFEILRPSQRGPTCSLQEAVDILYGLSLGAELPFLRIYAIEERFLGEYEALKGYIIKTEYSDDHSEYAYRIKDVLELSGGINLNKRNRLKKFFKQLNISLQPIRKENVHLCLEVQKAWCARRACSFCESFVGCEKNALAIMAVIFDEQVHTGIIGYFDTVPVGYAICEKKNEQMAFLYFGKSTVPDFFVYLIYMIVKMYFSDVACLNINEDMGNAGLRLFKAHLGIHELWRKYSCTFTRAIEGESDDRTAA